MNKILILSFLFTLPFCVHADTEEWSGQLTTTSYLNQHIYVTEDTTLAEGITVVEASNQNITITFQEKVKIYSNDNSSSVLILRAIAPYEITVHVTRDVKFGGVLNDLSSPLYILEEGDGTIRWRVEGEKELIFGSGNNRGGTKLIINLTESGMPTHIFEPRDSDSVIRFERHCGWGHAASLNLSADVEQYTVYDALNKTDEHMVRVEFRDGAGFGYEQRAEG